MRVDGPTPVEAESIYQVVEGWYEGSRWSIPVDFLSREHFERVVRTRIDWTSSPGYPYMLRSTNNGLLFGFDGVKPNPEKMDYVWNIVKSRLAGEDADPIRLFVKQEPHTRKKLDLERFRLISSVSVVDQIVDHMLFADMNDALLANWSDQPSKPGWSPFGGGWRHMPASSVWTATDSSAWDWTVQPWLLEMCLQLRLRLCKNPSEQWRELAYARYKQLFLQPVFITSGGLKLKQLKPGVMKSGCVNTIADNSLMQVLLHVRVCLTIGQPVTWLYTMGDDKLQEPMGKEKEYMELLSQFCILKQIQRKNEFAGFEFIHTRQGCMIEPVHKGKHAYNLLHAIDANLEQMGQSYSLNYHRSKHSGWIDDLFTQMGVKLFSRGFRDYIYDEY